MTVMTKRILILFSVALNIGFVIFAVNKTFTYHESKQQRIVHELTGIVQSLSLPQNKEKEAIDCITSFSEVIKAQERDLARSRDEIILYLAKPGTLDQIHLEGLLQNVDHLEKIKRDSFINHVTELRSIMGDEKGPLFFSLMLAQIDDSKHSHKK